MMNALEYSNIVNESRVNSGSLFSISVLWFLTGIR